MLKNETRATSPNSYYDYTYLGSRGPNDHSSAEIFDDKTNVLFYAKATKKAIGCWMTNETYAPDTQGSIDLSDNNYPTDINIDYNGNLWVLSNRLPVFLYKKLSLDHFNHHVLFGKASEVIKGNLEFVRTKNMIIIEQHTH